MTNQQPNVGLRVVQSDDQVRIIDSDGKTSVELVELTQRLVGKALETEEVQ